MGLLQRLLLGELRQTHALRNGRGRSATTATDSRIADGGAVRRLGAVELEANAIVVVDDDAVIVVSVLDARRVEQGLGGFCFRGFPLVL